MAYVFNKLLEVLQLETTALSLLPTPRLQSFLWTEPGFSDQVGFAPRDLSEQYQAIHDLGWQALQATKARFIRQRYQWKLSC
ncbi:hypothetical protein Ddye_003929 [Dipteronia dyeriana]|uniref:Uncharacterized protein n=1 Tax=Dipteronia dyeriana TaxID=168575 RepID=A0AAD9XTM7_9ROSI|nr:hypothetical protein Ddye_003929 [Dipteronia dyeriana]